MTRNGLVTKYRKIIVSTFLLLVIVFALTIQTSQAVQTNNNQTVESTHSIIISVDFAGYGDLDYDTYPDDVLVVTTFYLASSLYYHYYYRISLILPSGTTYTYYVEVHAWVDTVTIYNLFYNHATETGDYIVVVEAFLVYPDMIYTATGVIFDPPGGSNGGEPSFGVA